MPEFSKRHHLHDGGDGVGLFATDDLACHHRADWLIEHGGTAFAEHAHDVALRQDAFDAAFAHRQYGADLPFRQNLDRGRELGVRFDALDLVTFGIEDCTYRHCRLPEADRALERARSLFLRVFNQQLSAGLVAAHGTSTCYSSTFACLCLAS